VAGETTLYTIGYQGKTVETFISELDAAGVKRLIDVRRRPLSRKPGFAKKSLSGHLESAGIEYIHLVELGTPLDLFGLRKESGHHKLLAAYRKWLPDLVPELAELTELARETPCCLLCFELESTQCHRSVIADYLAEHEQFEIVNL
jgi:uncharacterized protein (DUF488 family)